MGFIICNLRDIVRNFYKKRNSVASILFILTAFLLIHLSLIRVQETPVIKVQQLKNNSSLESTVSQTSEKNLPCNNSCVEDFIDKFLLSDDDIAEELNENEMSTKTSSSRTSGEGEKRTGSSSSRTELADDNQNVLEYQPTFKEAEDDDGKSDDKSGFMLPTRLGGQNRKLYQEDVATNLSSTWTREMADRRRKVFQERAKTVKKGCQHLHKLGNFFSPKKGKIQDNLRWVRSHNMVWCPIFKSASTTWVKNLLLLAGEKYLDKSLHGRVRELYPKPSHPSERDHILASSMKVIIVRHPLDRLLSAYRDKMLRVRGETDPYVKIQQGIVEAYQDPNGEEPTTSILPSRRPSGENKTYSHPTFSQFLLKVKDDLSIYWKKEGLSQVNLHWRPYWMTCGPCKVNYDVIAHVETLEADQEYIIQELGLQDILYNAHTHASNFDSYNDTSEAAKHYFSKVPENLLKAIIKFYQPDFELFGYSPDPYIALTGKTT